MGGPGSGNHYHWWRKGKKSVVERCGSIDARRWGSKGILKVGIRQAGSWPVLSLSRGIIDINYEVLALDPARPVVRLSYANPAAKGEEEELKYDVRLTTTRPRFGGLRWWFICPLLSNGRP